MKKSESLKRVDLTPIEEIVDDAMEYLPERIDLSDPMNRQKIRNWMVRVCGTLAENNARAFGEAVQNAIQEAAALAINPEYYKERKRRREKRKALRAIIQNQDKPKSRAERQFYALKDSAVKM